MKKFLTLLLAAAMTLSLAACGSKTDDNSGNNSQPASALELLNACLLYTSPSPRD